MRLIKRSCPKCKYVLEGWQRGYYDFGNPIAQCPNCKTLIRREHINEWGLMNVLQKSNYILSLVVQIIGLTFGVGFIIGLLFYLVMKDSAVFVYKTVAPLNETFQNFTPLTYSIFTLSLLVVSVYEIYKFIQMINESNKRLNDPEYREMLKLFGVLKK